MTRRVRARFILRVLSALVLAPILLILGVLFGIYVLLPLLFSARVPLSPTTVLILMLVGIVFYCALEVAHEWEPLSHFLAWIVGRRWPQEVERPEGVLRYFFYIEHDDRAERR